MYELNYNVLKILAKEYLRKNLERFNEEEKIKFMRDLESWLTQKDDTISDEIYDFLIDKEIIHKPRRETIFTRYIKSKYSPIHHPKVLDIGACRLCKLSSKLISNGFDVSAIDPKIRLSEKESNELHISQIIKNNFYCDEFAPNDNGFDITPYDLLVGLEPCDATEHIIRQGLKYDKPFEILLCATHHKPLENRKIRTREEWYEYLQAISKEVKIREVKNDFIATNN